MLECCLPNQWLSWCLCGCSWCPTWNIKPTFVIWVKYWHCVIITRFCVAWERFRNPYILAHFLQDLEQMLFKPISHCHLSVTHELKTFLICNGSAKMIRWMYNCKLEKKEFHQLCFVRNLVFVQLQISYVLGISGGSAMYSVPPLALHLHILGAY